MLGVYISVGEDLSLGEGWGKYSPVLFYRWPVGIEYLGMLTGGCLGVLAVLLSSLILGGRVISSEYSSKLTYIGLGILVCLGILANMRLGMLSGIM